MRDFDLIRSLWWVCYFICELKTANAKTIYVYIHLLQQNAGQYCNNYQYLK
jgi:hypothetical protein